MDSTIAHPSVSPFLKKKKKKKNKVIVCVEVSSPLRSSQTSNQRASPRPVLSCLVQSLCSTDTGIVTELC